MVDRIITPENLMKIEFEAFKEGKRTKYRRRKLIFWFENGQIRGENATAYNLEHLANEIKAALAD
jgi:hypothetical protein